MEEGFRIWANPSSPHVEGRRAKAALEDARERCKRALGWEGELIFTSGASEAAVLALTQAHGGDRFVSAVEHDAILAAAPRAQRLAVLPNGSIDLDAMEAALAGASRPIVAVQWVNSETGNAQDLAEVLNRVDRAGGVLITDCAQGAGKYRMPIFADMAIVSAHKFGGPTGIGALLVRDFTMLSPQGGQERGYRRGTESLPLVLGMAAALESGGPPYLQEGMGPAILQLQDRIRDNGGVLLSDQIERPTMIQAVAMPGISGRAQLMRFDMAGIAVSQGSACSSGSLKPSHVLAAMGIGDDLASRMIRVSFGWSTTPAEVERFCETWLAMAGDVVR